MLISYHTTRSVSKPTFEMGSTMRLGLGRDWTTIATAAQALLPSAPALGVTETLVQHQLHKKDKATRRLLREKDAELEDLSKRLSGIQHAWKCNSAIIVAQNGHIAEQQQRFEFDTRRKNALIQDKEVYAQGLLDEKAEQKTHWTRLMKDKNDALAAKNTTEERLTLCEKEKAEVESSLKSCRARNEDLHGRQRKIDSLRVDAEKEVKKLDNLNRSLEKRLAEATTGLTVAKHSLEGAEKRAEEEKQKIEAIEKVRDEAEAKLAAKEEAEIDAPFEDPVEEERQAWEAKLSNTLDKLEREKQSAAEERQMLEAKLHDLLDQTKRKETTAQESYQALETKLSNSQDEFEHQKTVAADERQALQEKLSNPQDEFERKKTAAEEERKMLEEMLSKSQDELERQNTTTEEERKALDKKLSNSQDELEHQKLAAEDERLTLEITLCKAQTGLETKKKQCQKLLNLAKSSSKRAEAACKELNELRAERDGDGGSDGNTIRPSKSQEKLIDARMNLVELLNGELRLKDWQLKRWSEGTAQYCEEGVSAEVNGDYGTTVKGEASSLPFHIREIEA